MNPRTRNRALLAALIAALAFGLRVYASFNLPVDYDEAIYLKGAQNAARAIRAGNFAALTTDEVSPENPPLSKLAMGAALAILPPRPPVATDINTAPPDDLLRAARLLNALIGAVTTAALALISPLAGLALAAHSLHLKYTSEVLLEALPALASLVCVMAYARAKSQPRPGRWLVVSGIALGVTAASKYVYGLCAIAILADWFLGAPSKKRVMGLAAGWGAIALIAFFLADPYLWPAPIERLLGTLAFHRANSSAAINAAKYVAWQSLAWLATPHLSRIAHGLPQPDALIFVLAAIGLIPLWRARRVYALWLVLGLAFLLAYSNKWPQYGLIIAAPLCLSASAAAGFAWRSRGRVSAQWALSGVMGLAALTWCAWLGGNWHWADPSFQQAMSVVQQNKQNDEALLFVSANPFIELAAQQGNTGRWDATPNFGLDRLTSVLDYDTAAQFLNAQAAGKMGVWLMTYQGNYGDPADNARALLQRQAHLLSPAFTQEFTRSYQLAHFRFDSPFELVAPSAAFEQHIQNGETRVENGYGQMAGLSSRGCLLLSDTPAADPSKHNIEIGCLWQTRPFAALDWQTKISARMMNERGETIAQADQLIGRSGFPIVKFEGAFFGNYTLEVPLEARPGGYTIAIFAYSQGKEFSPRVVMKY